MKKNVMKYEGITAANIAAKRAAMVAAKDAYDSAKDELVSGLAAFLEQNPNAVVVNKDMAHAAGLTPTHMASIVQHGGWNKGIESDSMTVTKQYVEIDEDGKPIEGGATLTVNKTLTVYRKRRNRSRW